ncbi:MAG: hypothetical protein AB7O96_13865 [Pseudobdellovibrionaceae bacterium]
MKYLLATLFMISSSSAFACFDRNAKDIKMKAIFQMAASSKSLDACLAKMDGVGVILESASAKIKYRSQNDSGPITRTLVITGKNEARKMYRLSMSYNLPKHTWECGEPTDNIPRCL